MIYIYYIHIFSISFPMSSTTSTSFDIQDAAATSSSSKSLWCVDWVRFESLPQYGHILNMLFVLANLMVLNVTRLAYISQPAPFANGIENSVIAAVLSVTVAFSFDQFMDFFLLILIPNVSLIFRMDKKSRTPSTTTVLRTFIWVINIMCSEQFLLHVCWAIGKKTACHVTLATFLRSIFGPFHISIRCVFFVIVVSASVRFIAIYILRKFVL